ncbi:MAG: hypothetical protein ACKO6B_03975, partial [Planctomycetia bacterium]
VSTGRPSRWRRIWRASAWRRARPARAGRASRRALVAMGLEPAAIRGAVRLSVGWTTTAADVEEAIARLTPLVQRMAT